MFLPIRSKNPPESFPGVTILLILVNVIVYALTSQDGLIAKESVVQEWGLKGSHFDLVHMVSSMFLHGGLFHLLGNMWFLYIFGFAVEGRLKAPRFILLYLASGMGGDLLHQAMLGGANPDIPSIGASGAIMGVVGAGIYMFPFAEITVFYRFIYFGVTQWPLWGVALMYLGMDALFAFVGASDGVGHFAHLGGAGAGFILAFVLRGARDSKSASEAKAFLADAKDFSILAPHEFAAIAKNDQNNTLLAVHWLQRSARSSSGAAPDAMAYFTRLLPQIVQEQDPRVVGSALQMAAIEPGRVPCQYLLSVAMRCEQVGELRVAMNLYEMALRDPAISEGDREASMYRNAMVSERMFGDPARAVGLYQAFLQRYPMSPMTDQARTRLAALAVRRPT